MAQQGALTVILPVLPANVAPLRNALEQVLEEQGSVRKSTTIPFLTFTTVHFMRWVLLEAEDSNESGRVFGAQLVFSTNYDLPLAAHLDDMVGQAYEGLAAIFSHCQGFPDQPTPQKLVAYLGQNQQPAAAFYVGTRGRSYRQIKAEADLRDRLESRLDEVRRQPGWLAQSPQAMRAALQEFVRQQADMVWALTPPPAQLDAGAQRLAWAKGLGVVGAVVAGVVGPLIWGAGLWKLSGVAVAAGLAGLLRRQEQQDNARARLNKWSYTAELGKKVYELARREDHLVQNQLTHLVEVKLGWLRQLTLRTILAAINTLAVVVFNKGELGGIPSIHFARWVIIDGGRRLLFFSNFDGSWENYLGDFIDKASVGLTGVWSNTVGFPPTRWLVLDGATDEQQFKLWAREKQRLTNVWYSAYPGLTVQNINNNSAIRAGLAGPMTDEEAQRWLRLL